MTRRTIRTAVALALLAPAIGSALAAEGLRCSAFLHEKDGTWRSFESIEVLGPDGVVHFKGGERISPTSGSSKGAIARALNEICEK